MDLNGNFCKIPLRKFQNTQFLLLFGMKQTLWIIPEKIPFLSGATEPVSAYHSSYTGVTFAQDVNSHFGFLHLFQPSAELQPHVHTTPGSCSEGKKKNTGA